MLKYYIPSILIFAATCVTAAPTITEQPVDLSAVEGGILETTVKAVSNQADSIDMDLFVNGSEYTGSITKEISQVNNDFTGTLRFRMLTDLEGEYFIRLSDASGSTDSDTKTITLALPNIIITRGSNSVTAPGGSFTLLPIIESTNSTASAEYYDFSWRRNGLEVSNENIYTISEAGISDTGSYTLRYNRKGETDVRTAGPVQIVVSDFWAKNLASYTEVPSFLNSPFGFGTFLYNANTDWIWITGSNFSQNGFGWIVINSTDPANTWFYDLTLEWCYTTLLSFESENPLWPWLYSVERNAWLYYVEDSVPRTFYDSSSQTFIEIPQ